MHIIFATYLQNITIRPCKMPNNVKAHLEFCRGVQPATMYFIGESCKCTPRKRNKSNSRAHFWCAGKNWSVRAVNRVVLGCVSKATTKKGRILFSRKKGAPHRENPGYASFE